MPKLLQQTMRQPERGGPKIDGTPPCTRAEKVVVSVAILISLLTFAAWFASAAYSWDLRAWLHGEKAAVQDSSSAVDIARLLP